MDKTINNRNLGEIYTPEHIARLMKNETKKYLGDDFEDKFIIWDCAWGTGNLTKVLDGNGDLYCSTLRGADVRNGRRLKGHKFVYDFLNEDIDQLFSVQAMWVADHKNIPQAIVDSLNDPDGKPILFYVNPPYVSTGVFGANNTDFREGATDSKIKTIMNEQKLGTATNQLYVQFMYRIQKMLESYPNKKIYMSLIIPPQVLTVASYTEFRKTFLTHFKFLGGALFRANNFQGLGNRWGISIQLWAPGKTENTHEFKFDLYRNGKDTIIKHVGYKTLYNVDDIPNGQDIAIRPLLNSNKVLAPATLSSGAKFSNKKQIFWDKDSIGFIFFKGNNVYHNVVEAGIMCLPYSDGSGFAVTHENFWDALAFYTARRSIGVYDRDWVIDKDEYSCPDISTEAYKILKANALIYALFNDSTHFSGLLRKEDNRRFYNTFNFLSLDDLASLGFDTSEIESEYNKSGCDFVVQSLRQVLSSGLALPSGVAVVEQVKKLYKDTMPLREKFNATEDGATYQVTNWDAGWYQIKWILKKYDNDTYTKFRLLYRQFSRDISELVYASGFLKYRPVDFNGNVIRIYEDMNIGDLVDDEVAEILDQEEDE